MPERQEDHRLDRAELEHRFEGGEKISGRKVEQVEAVQSERHAYVVDDCGVYVATVGAPIAVMVVAERLQEDDDERHQWLHQTELQRGLLAEAQESNSVSLPVQAARSVEARRADRLAPDLGHDVTLAAQVLIAQG